MSKKKPTYLLFIDLVSPINKVQTEIESISNDINNIKKSYVIKGSFVYIMSLFESSLLSFCKQILMAFPEKIDNGKIDSKELVYIKDSTFTYEVIEVLIDDHLSSLSQKNLSDVINAICSYSNIDRESLDFNISEFTEIKERRNILVHNNLFVDKKYIRKVKCNHNLYGTQLDVNTTYLEKTLKTINKFLIVLKKEIVKKYSFHNKEKLIRDIWDYFFDSPLLRFDEYCKFNNGKFQFYDLEVIKRHKESLSHSEKNILAYIMQNYSPSMSDMFFDIKDLSMQVSVLNMKEIVEVFDRYPLLLQE